MSGFSLDSFGGNDYLSALLQAASLMRNDSSETSIGGGSLASLAGPQVDPSQFMALNNQQLAEPGPTLLGPQAPTGPTAMQTALTQASATPPTNTMIPPIQPIPAWQQALAATAQVNHDLMARPRPQMIGAPDPRLFVPQGGGAPTLGTSLPQRISPLQNYAILQYALTPPKKRRKEQQQE
jgi:hypothetical protein